MEKHIFLPSKEKQKLERDFKTSGPTVWAALRYKTNSRFAKMLRAVALQRGGVVYDESKAAPGYTPDCVTTFETADKTMTQRFSDRAFLIADMGTGNVTVYADGEPVQEYTNVYLNQLADIQANVQELAKRLKK